MVDVSTIFGVVKWIGSVLIKEGKYLLGVEDKVESLKNELKCMLEFLQRVDAQPHLIKEKRQLCILTETLQELAFDAKDVIDTFIVEGLEPKKSVYSNLATLTTNPVRVRKLGKKIDDIQQKIQEAHKRFQTFGLFMEPIVASSQQQEEGIGSSSSRPIPEDYIHLEDEFVVGIGNDINQLVQRLTNPEDDFKVLGIVGTAGGGKTTLATQLYCHDIITRRFSNKAFVSISQKWSKVDLLHSIFKQFFRDTTIPSRIDEVVKKLHNFMKNEQCLVVLDDIWNTEAWDQISRIFRQTKNSFRVVLTTRIKEVVLHADEKCIIHEPKLLTEVQKWKLFSKIAMEGRVGIDKNAEFEELGQQMLKKCTGLPLAVVTLAGILRKKRDVYEWKYVSKTCNDSIFKGKRSANYGVIEDMLELSYLDLPNHLKPCLLYLGCFPEDCEIEAKVLIRMWIAEGFVTNDVIRGDVTLEDEAMHLLTDLAQRCILQVTDRDYRGQIHKFRVHDLMRVLCIKKAKEHHFFEVAYSNVGAPSYPRRIANFSGEHLPIEKKDHLRTLVFLPKEISLATMDLEYLQRCKLLRVLSIQGRGHRCVGFPEKIGKLIHLRYLTILGTDISKLPKSIRDLQNLLYLVYLPALAGEEPEVPNDLARKMENLIGLVLPNDIKRDSAEFKTLGLSGSKNLCTLSSGAGKWMEKDLPTLSVTVQSLKIRNIEKKEEIEAIYKCPSIKEGRLCELACSSQKPLVFDLQKVRNCGRLSTLCLDLPLAKSRNGALRFPPNLVELSLSYTAIEQGVDIMHVLGELEKLKSLSLGIEAYLGTRLSCSATSFKKLEELELQRLDALEEWSMERGAMRCLNKLTIKTCRKLNRLPQSISRITTLKVLEFRDMPREFCMRLGYEDEESVDVEDDDSVIAGEDSEDAESTEGEDSYIIRHIPSVKFSQIH